MILYLDTSSIVKLYVEESGSLLVREALLSAEMIATCRIAYPETYSAFARRFRSGELTVEQYTYLCRAFETDWQSYVTLDFDEQLAADFVKKYPLRGFDAIHLAAACRLRSLRQWTPMVTFSCFDKKLLSAALAEGLAINPVENEA